MAVSYTTTWCGSSISLVPDAFGSGQEPEPAAAEPAGQVVGVERFALRGGEHVAGVGSEVAGVDRFLRLVLPVNSHQVRWNVVTCSAAER
jgi:hypothetical protein